MTKLPAPVARKFSGFVPTAPVGLLLAALALAVPAIFPTKAEADGPQRITVHALKRAIVSENPQARVETVDHERLAVRRIDIDDDDGTIRMSLASPADDPIVDGIRYGTATVLAQDHANGGVIGWRVVPDGSVSFGINQRAPLLREAAIGDRLMPGIGAARRVSLDVAADGKPTIALADAHSRPRVRLTVTDDGYGAIEFLDAHGDVIEVIAPEAGGRSDG